MKGKKKLTKAQRVVLEQLANGGKVVRDGTGVARLYPSGRIVRDLTLDWLYYDVFVTTVESYVITEAGRKALREEE